jgi:NADH dehydrogenase [ubiquinone] 1 alpha subcomplex assembly factor 5
MEMVNRQKGMKRNANFDTVAIIGQNPHLFLRHIEKGYEIKHLYVCDTTQKSVSRSMDKIQQMVDDNYFGKNGLVQPGHIEPMVVDEEEWGFEEESLDLIVNNLSCHWVNRLETAFLAFSKSLKPNGAYLGSMFGGDTLQELRIAFNLAEAEREGGYSPTTSPLMTMTDIGNIFAR